MSHETRHLSVVVAADPERVYAFAGDPRNLSRWASGLGAAVDEGDGTLVVDGPLGRVTVRFAPRNEFGVLDHDVELPNGETVHNPLRVLAHPTGSEVVFTLRWRDGVSAEEFEGDAATIASDLETLRVLAESEA
ncbi:SRPBCC family protein [Pseudonocardia endophytica]|uniref:Polyketide cyclase/dehydrase/lipid transport protein n=1 Tax=Pseudonocardia endophytica TaxID=401976 RepID=A0A4R1HK16_PSEEN|nr:SRPBCC family protein [Pseudonocardia endophytica]TCK19899.1 polyketide cyclase/dehydrase/lipid transport protein [Pseudonocardia endophytica]